MKLNKMFKLASVALATSVAMGAMVAPSTAAAETSATFTAANMYLWRGINLTPSGAAVSGSLDYSNAGFYAGVWTTTETDGHETDLYLGYGGEVAGFSYDISFWKYLYPEDVDGTTGDFVDMGDNDLSEFVLSLGYGPVSFALYSNAESGIDDYMYYTLGVDFDKFNLTYGTWDHDVAGSNEYSHITLSYAATDELTFAVSTLSNDTGFDTPALGGYEEDPLFMVSYSKSFDLK